MKKIPIIFLTIFLLLGLIALFQNSVSIKKNTPEGNAKNPLYLTAMGQGLFSNQVILNQDKDEDGEYGTLRELSGSSSSRVKTAASSLIPRTFCPPEKSTRLVRHGYIFQMFLPGEKGWESEKIKTTNKQEIIDAQEKHFICYAWPKKIYNGSQRIFVINEEGDIYASDNEGAKQGYYGEKKAPRPDAAIDEKFKDLKNPFSGSLADGVRGKDGGIWRAVD